MGQVVIGVNSSFFILCPCSVSADLFLRGVWWGGREARNVGGARPCVWREEREEKRSRGCSRRSLLHFPVLSPAAPKTTTTDAPAMPASRRAATLVALLLAFAATVAAREPGRGGRGGAAGRVGLGGGTGDKRAARGREALPLLSTSRPQSSPVRTRAPAVSSSFLSHSHSAHPLHMSESCIPMAMSLQTGPCAAHAALVGNAASSGCAGQPNPGPECCAQLSAFAAAGCACDAPTLSLASAMGVSEAQIKGVLRGASAACAATGPPVSGPCFDACA